MFYISCPTCKGKVGFNADGTKLICQNCGNEVIAPKGYSVLESSFNFAEDARARRDFSSAADAYSEIIKQHPDSAGAYWGRALSRFGVEYQPIDGGYRLVCHMAQKGDFASDEDVKAAVRLAAGDESAYYKNETERITALQRRVDQFASLTEPYDIIVTAGPDSASLEAAANIQAVLRSTGRRVFSPALELQSMPGADWEPVLYHAFASAKTLVVAAKGKAAFTPDVIFDAERFIYKKVSAQRAASGQIPVLVIAFDDLNEYEDIPDSVFDGADERISLADPEFANILCSAAAGTASDFGSTLRTETSAHDNFEYSNLIRQARLQLESGNFSGAISVYEKVLNYNFRESQAYWGKLLASNSCRNEEELISKGGHFRSDSSYRNALAFANEREQQTYQQVIEDAEKSAVLHERQRQASEQQKQEERRLREEKAAEVSEARKEKVRSEQKESKKSAARILAPLAIAAVVVIVSYFIYSITIGKDAAKYEEAYDLYTDGAYVEAAALFEELGDYRDSADMVIQSNASEALRKFHSVREHEIEQRPNAVAVMREVAQYVPEAQSYLDRWEAEAADYYAKGQYYHAYYALQAYGTDAPEYIDSLRVLLGRGLIDSSPTKAYTCLSLHPETGAVWEFGCFGLYFEHIRHLSVSLSDSARSAAAVRADGTVYLTGNVSSAVSVSDWTDMICVQTTDTDVVALSRDGSLKSAAMGDLASDVKQFTFNDSGVAAVRRDGTVYCSVDSVASDISSWSDVAYIAMTYREGGYVVLGVTGDGKLLQYGCNYTDVTENVLAVAVGGSSLAVIDMDNRVCILDADSDESSYSNVLWVSFAEPALLRVAEDGSVSALIHGTSDDEVEFRKYLNSLSVGFQNDSPSN